MSFFDDELYVKADKKDVSEAQGTYALREAWKTVYGEYPSDRALAILWAKTCLETGRFKVGFWNWNFGNIKAKEGETFTMYECGEELSLDYALKEKAKHPDLVIINKQYSWSNGSKRASVTFKPGHYQTKFRAYSSLEDGAVSYLKFVSQKKRYMKAFEFLKQGDPIKYSYALSEAGYYTADPKRYTAGVVRLFEEFLRRKDELLSWKPEDRVKVEPDPVEVQKAVEKNVSKVKNDGLIVPSAEDSNIDNEKPVVNKSRSPAKTGVFIFIAAGIASIYAWLTGLF